MLIEQSFELRVSGHPARICPAITGCFHEKNNNL